MGVDIGHATLKVVGVASGWAGPRLVGAATIPIPEDTVSKQGLNKTKELAAALRKAMTEAKPHPIRARRVVSALPASLVMTKLLELPILRPKELAQTVPHEADQAFPVPISELEIDWLVLPKRPPTVQMATQPPTQPSTKKQSGERKSKPAQLPPPATMEVLVIGAPKVAVASLVEFFADLNFDLAALEIKPVANTRATASNYEREPHLLVDIGAEDTSLAVVDLASVQHVTTLDFGADRLNIDTADAAELATRTLPLVEEFQAVTHFAGQRLGEHVRRIRLVGGGARTPNLARVLSSQTNQHVELANPRRHLHGAEKIPTTDLLPLTTAIGLSLRLVER